MPDAKTIQEIFAVEREGRKVGREEERARIRAKVEGMVDAADEKIIAQKNVGVAPLSADTARRDGLLDFLRWLNEEAV